METILIEVAKILAYVLAGGFVVPVVNWIKEKANLEQWAAFALSLVVSGVFGAAVVFAEGQLVPGDLTPENLSVIFTTIFVAAQAVYNMLKSNDGA